ncbi:MAG TPA: ferrous iron transport protein B [Candidatus Baltobacteraceae bacterium]|jgi:ferrous iron transport protein B|nr:ferrous iron transport protein B [Candidatus Baltobacteraceae bacterium]
MDTKSNAQPVAAIGTSSHPPASLSPRKPVSAAYAVLTGNPNSGKTTVFNGLTGLRARVGNYAGVTVERKEGRFQGSPSDLPIIVLDLPGTYSLSPQSLDEQIARDVLLQRLPDVPPPSVVVVVVDASNLERNLYFASQVIELGHPTVIALNMVDVAEKIGHRIDVGKLAAALRTPVVPMVASTGEGLRELQQEIIHVVRAGALMMAPETFCDLPPAFEAEIDALAATLPGAGVGAGARALLILTDAKSLSAAPMEARTAVVAARERLTRAGLDWRSAPIEARYARIGAIQRAVTTEPATPEETRSDKLDRIVTHKVWGMVIFVGIMAVMFLTIFSFAQLPMDLLQGLFRNAGDVVGRLIPPGDLQGLLVKGVIQGVGSVVVFLPQICLLFLFIGLLEDTGYMARAAFLMDRLMSKVGLHGKSFIPMLSSFACAIPGIMATRTIETPKDRLVTILVAPLMSCSARLPVYTLLIAACMPGRIALESATMLSMYLLGIVVALGMAWIFKKTLLKGETPMLVMELPPYKRPLATVVLRHMWDRSKLFLRRAGTVILGINILLWFLASYPRHADVGNIAKTDPAQAGQRLRGSFAGMAGHFIEPVIAPLGFDWKIGIGIVSSFAAREVFVSTMSIVYNVAEGTDEDTHTRDLAQVMRQQKRPDGRPVYTTLTAITLMVFYVLALQCVSTVAVVRRETNSWKWPLFQWLYMGALAWIFAFVTYQGGRLLGFG